MKKEVSPKNIGNDIINILFNARKEVEKRLFNYQVPKDKKSLERLSDSLKRCQDDIRRAIN